MQLPKPQYNLGLGGLSHGAVTGRMIEKIEEILSQEKPHFTLVYGDTDSTLAGALASVKLHIPIIHIEAENTDCIYRLQEIFTALREIAKQTQVILPLHPRTQKILMQKNISTQGVTILEPVSYLEMIYLLQSCKMVLTDSGGLQKEAYFFKKPCLTLRDETEWVELVEKGYNTIVGANKEKIIQGFLKIADNSSIEFCNALYGEGKAAEIIIQTIKKEICKGL